MKLDTFYSRDKFKNDIMRLYKNIKIHFYDIYLVKTSGDIYFIYYCVTKCFV